MKKNFLKISKFFTSVSTLQVKRFLCTYTQNNRTIKKNFLKIWKFLLKRIQNFSYAREIRAIDPRRWGLC